MASNYDFYNDDWEEQNEHEWDVVPAGFWDDVTSGHGWDDEYGKMLFDLVFIDPDTSIREQTYQALQEWMRDEYGIDFDAEFDWEGWREWYG